MYAPVGVATSWRRLRHTAVLALGLVGCHWVRSGNSAVVAPVAAAQVKAIGDCAPCRDSVDIVAMGVHGFLMVPWRDSTELVMTPPSYTTAPDQVPVVPPAMSSRSRVVAPPRKKKQCECRALRAASGWMPKLGHHRFPAALAAGAAPK